ncbi:MAG TPA: helix-turn-helix domain-containing protein, partial [Pirellulaceae bacterium]
GADRPGISNSQEFARAPGIELPPPLRHASESNTPLAAMGEWSTLADVERDHIALTLRETDFNQSAASRLLGIDRKMLARKIKKYRLADSHG